LKNKAVLSRWPENRPPPKQDEIMAALEAEGLRPYRMVDPPCTYYHTESKSTHEVRWVVHGRMKVGLDDREIVLDSGDRIDLPPQTPHWVRILSDDGAVYLIASRSI